jgi:hypothetical protein
MSGEDSKKPPQIEEGPGLWSTLRPAGERQWKGGELRPANRPAALTAEEYRYAQERRAAGVPDSAIARALGRPLSTLRKPLVIEDDAQAPDPEGLTIQQRFEIEQERRRRAAEAAKAAARAARAGKEPTTVWRAPPKP